MSLQVFFDNFALLVEAPNGVVKLRELILQLAVQGKLGSHYAADAPASLLLETLKIEKASLIEEKNIRRIDEELAPIDRADQPFELAPSWQWCRIGDFAVIRGGKRLPNGASFSSLPTRRVYIQVTNMKKGTILQDGLKYIDENVFESIKQYTIEKDDIYITIAGTIGQVGIVPEFFHGMNLTENAAKIVFRGLNKDYLLLALTSDTLQQQFTQKTNQMAQPKLALKRIADALFPLPPLEEQKRIVAKVDELMRLCDELEARQQARRESRVRLNSATLAPLNNAASLAPEEFEQTAARLANNFATLYDSAETVGKLRSTLFQLAVHGRLVLQDARDEPASVLLERIGEPRQGSEEKQRKRKVEVSTVSLSDVPFTIPAEWVWTRLGKLTKLIEYGTSEKASLNDKGVPIFRMNNIVDGRVLHANLKYVSPSIKDLPKLYLQRHDLLFNRTNSYELVGKTGIFKGESDKFTFASYLIRIRLFDSLISAEYVNLAMNAGYFRATQINTEVTQQCGQANFNGTKLANTLIPLPPLAEQKRIVAKVNQLMTLCDELETKLRQAEADSAKLMNAAVQHVLASVTNSSEERTQMVVA